MSFHLVHQNTGNNSVVVGLWSDDLPVSVLETMLTRDTLGEYRSLDFRLLKRRLEWLKTRILLDHLAPGVKMQFLPNGKPTLSGALHVSVSHSGRLAAVAVSDSLVGIDVQPAEPKLQNMKSRFCNARELDYLKAARQDDILAIIWAAKEAVFKYFGERVEFANEMNVLPFSPDDEVLLLRYEGRHGSGNFELGHLFWLNQHVVYTRKFSFVGEY